MRFPLSAAAVLVLAACSPASDSLNPPADAGPRHDAGVHGDAGEPRDAGEAFDAGAADDGGVNADAGSTDAGDADAGTAPTWCTGRPEDFCEDFDRPALTSSAWAFTASDGTTGAGLPPGGLGTAEYTSAPNAFAANAPMISTGATIVQIQKSTGSSSSPNHVDADFAFSVRVASLCGGSRMEIARIEGINPINFASYGLAILVSSSGAAIELTQGFKALVTMPLATAPANDTWTRVTIHLGMELVVNGPPTSLTVTIGTGAPESFSLDRGMGVRPNVKLGLNVTGPSVACEVDYDDFTYDAL